jgi:hypothetical protein
VNPLTSLEPLIGFFVFASLVILFGMLEELVKEARREKKIEKERN